MKSYKQVYSRKRGPFSQPSWMELGIREKVILDSKLCCDFPHKLNKDCEFYLSDDCISYYCPLNGSFVVCLKTKKVVN